MSIETMQQAVETIRNLAQNNPMTMQEHDHITKVLLDLLSAIEQAQKQEPVAIDDAGIYEFWARNKENEQKAKNRNPMRLTDEEVNTLGWMDQMTLKERQELVGEIIERLEGKTEQHQNPVAYGTWDTMLGKGNRMMMVRLDKGQDGCTVPLYTSPPQRQSVDNESDNG